MHVLNIIRLCPDCTLFLLINHLHEGQRFTVERTVAQSHVRCSWSRLPSWNINPL